MLRALVVVGLLLALASSASAQVAQGAAAAAAAAARTYSQAEILAMFEGGTVRAGTASLRGGFSFPVLAGAGLVAGALAWLYSQANTAAHPALDAYNNFDGSNCSGGAAGTFPPQNGGMIDWCKFLISGSQGTYQVSFSVYPSGDSGFYMVVSCPGSTYFNSNGLRNQAGVSARYAEFQSMCVPPAGTKPSLPDWIRGTYTPAPGQVAVPHPEIIPEINFGIRGYLPTVPMLTPDGNPAAGISIGIPKPTQDVWEDGCNSGADWNGSICATPDPFTQPCAVGFYRPFAGAVCEASPNPEPACGAGLYRPYAGASCQAVQPACQVGYSRPNLGGACAPDPVSPAPIQTNCPDMIGGDGLLGFVVTFFPNFVSITKCMFVPSRDIPARVSQLSAYGKSKFPFSVAAQLQSAFAPVVMAGDASVLPTNAGFFTLDWAWLTPLWALIKISVGSFIHFSALWFMWNKLSPQVVV